METESAAGVRLVPPPPHWVLRTMNQVMRPLLASPLGRRMDGVMLLEFQGRRSGRTIRVPVNVNRVDGVLMAFTEGPWRHNFATRIPVTVTYRGRTHHTHGTLVRLTPEEMGAAVRKSLDSGGSAQRMGIRSPKGHEPTAEELAALAPALGRCAIRLELEPAALEE